MISKEETAVLLKRMAQSRPKKLFHRFDDTNAGIGCVVRYLGSMGRPVSAGPGPTGKEPSARTITVSSPPWPWTP